MLAPDREQIPEARPVVSLGGADEPEFAREVRRRLSEEIPLRRRGIDSGRVAELRPDGLLPPRPRRRRREVIQRERWVAARPIFLPGAVQGVRGALASEDPSALLARLGQPEGLAAWLEQRAGRLAPEFRITDPAATLFDPERDLARVTLLHSPATSRPRAEPGGGLRAARVPEVGDATRAGGGCALWLKTSRLSLDPTDRSLRLRAAFGVEGEDDASADEASHAATRELAERLFPAARALDRMGELWDLLASLAGTPVRPSAHIAYWNAPNGGARFHHDSFADPPGSTSQRGVLYAQLSGRTFWLALSIEDLAARVREFLAWIAEGDLPHLRAVLEERWLDLQEVASRRAALLAELARPAGGLCAPFLDGPEFTTLLVDAGHALLLRPGDALLLPNHSLERTAMHSVFSASRAPAYALSVALRG